MQSETVDVVPRAATCTLDQATSSNVRLVPPLGELDETFVVFDSCLFPPLYENMTLSAKPEVHNIWHCGQRRTEPRPRVTCTDNVVKFGHVVFIHASRQTNKQTDRHADRNTQHTSRGQSKYFTGMEIFNVQNPHYTITKRKCKFLSNIMSSINVLCELCRVAEKELELCAHQSN